MTMREAVAFENGGKRLFGVWEFPEEREAPVVVVCHGFASHKVGSQRIWVRLAELLAQEGMATFRFDFRGSGDSEGSLAETSFSEMVADVGAAFKVVRGERRVDGERLGVFGSSLGGAIGVEATARDRKVKALALWAPVASGHIWLEQWMAAHPENHDSRSALESYRGEKISSQFRQEFATLAADQTVGALPVPLLHLHGEEDEVISLLHQQAYLAAREDAPAESHFLTYPATNHMLASAKERTQILEEVAAWFRKHL